VRVVNGVLTAAVLLSTAHLSVNSLAGRSGATRPPMVLTEASGPLRCYHLVFDPATFSHSVPMRVGDSLPEMIALSDTDLVAEWHLAAAWRTRPTATWSEAKWAVGVNDSIDVIVPTLNWAVGVSIRLPAVGNSVTGRARAYLDTPSKRHAKVRVLATMVRCPDGVPLRFPSESPL
jgi:hypothetical protein